MPGWRLRKSLFFARELALSLGGNQVATVGHFSVKPNLINVIPNHVVMSVDLRNTDNAILMSGGAAIGRICRENVAGRGRGDNQPLTGAL